MFTQRPLLTVLPLLLLSISNYGQKAERTLVQSFHLQGMNMVQLDLEGEIELREWNNPALRIQMAIQLEEGSESTLYSLITSHRYDLKSKIEDNLLQIFAPGLQKKVSVGGKEVNETIRFIVSIPKNVVLKQNSVEVEIVEGTSLK